ncbi:hypothetical protein BGX38DRAFT_1092344, partial [Terfezia claveryi]
GPYSHHLPLGRYGTVLFFATGIGITPIISYIQSLMHCRKNRGVNTQYIHIYWTVETRRHCDWAVNLINTLIDDDCEYVSSTYT